MKENVIQINGGCECKKCHVCEKNYFCNPTACSCENRKYLACIMDNSVIICDEVIDADTEAKLNNEAKSNNKETKTIPTNFNENRAICKTQNFYLLLAFLLITIALLIAVSI